MAGQGHGCARLRRAVARLGQMVEEHHEDLDVIFRAEPVDQPGRRRIGVDETFTPEDENRQRKLVQNRLQNRCREGLIGNRSIYLSAVISLSAVPDGCGINRW